MHFIKESKICAYCHYHHMFLTKKEINLHGCLRKQCQRLQKNNDNPIWENRKIKKALQKERKKLFLESIGA